MKFKFNSGRPARKPRTKKDMIAYLSDHFRYSTMNSWNGNTSYAVKVKLHCIDFPDNETRDNAYSWLSCDFETDEVFYETNKIMREFAKKYNWAWQLGFNGRSSGYLVLYQGGRKQLDHKSRCNSCGQLNFKLVPPPPLSYPPSSSEDKLLTAYLREHNNSIEALKKLPELKGLGFFPGEIERLIDTFKQREVDTSYSGPYTVDARCGRCNKETRVNLSEPLYETYTSGYETDQFEDFKDWDMDTLRDRVELVWDFDKTVESAVAAFVENVYHFGSPSSLFEEDEEQEEEAYA